jgi:hypothetical protein
VYHSPWFFPTTFVLSLAAPVAAAWCLVSARRTGEQIDLRTSKAFLRHCWLLLVLSLAQAIGEAVFGSRGAAWWAFATVANLSLGVVGTRAMVEVARRQRAAERG